MQEKEARERREREEEEARVLEASRKLQEVMPETHTD